MNNLKDLVLKNIEDTGYLNQIRAQLKLQVFKIIENQDEVSKNNAGFQWQHPQQLQLKGMQYGLNSLQLIIEYLEFFKLDYTAQVLRKEANISDPTIRENLQNKIGLSGKCDQIRPLLITLLSEYHKSINFQESPTVKVNPIISQDSKQQQSNQQQAKEIPKDKAKPIEVKNNQANKQEIEQVKKVPDQKVSVEPKKEPATAVNKIRGGGNSKINSMYGFNNISNKSKTQYDGKEQIDYLISGGANSSIDPYAFDLGGGGKSTNMNASDQYAFDLDAPIKKSSTTGKGNLYDYNVDSDQQKGKQNNAITIKESKFNSQPYSFDVPDKTVKKSFKKEEIQEDLDDFIESKEDKKQQSNNMFTSSEDIMKATQSMGIDESVDSLALEEYDYYEDVTKKR